VYIKVRANNIVGSSEYLLGNGAILVTIPDAPLNLADVPAITSMSQVGLAWTDGLEDGGSPVIDYRVFKSISGADAFDVANSGITTQSYTVTGMVTGTTYDFKV